MEQSGRHSCRYWNPEPWVTLMNSTNILENQNYLKQITPSSVETLSGRMRRRRRKKMKKRMKRRRRKERTTWRTRTRRTRTWGRRGGRTARTWLFQAWISGLHAHIQHPDACRLEKELISCSSEVFLLNCCFYMHSIIHLTLPYNPGYSDVLFCLYYFSPYYLSYFLIKSTLMIQYNLPNIDESTC